MSARAAAPGALVNQQTPIVTLLPPALELVVNVQESQLGQIAEGQSVELQVPAFPTRTFSGVVKAIAPTIDDNSRTTEVRIEPHDASNHQNFAISLAGIGDYKRAEQEVRRAQELAPESPEIRRFLDALLAFEQSRKPVIVADAP